MIVRIKMVVKVMVVMVLKFDCRLIDILILWNVGCVKIKILKGGIVEIVSGVSDGV